MDSPPQSCTPSLPDTSFRFVLICCCGGITVLPNSVMQHFGPSFAVGAKDGFLCRSRGCKHSVSIQHCRLGVQALLRKCWACDDDIAGDMHHEECQSCSKPLGCEDVVWKYTAVLYDKNEKAGQSGGCARWGEDGLEAGVREKVTPAAMERWVDFRTAMRRVMEGTFGYPGDV